MNLRKNNISHIDEKIFNQLLNLKTLQLTNNKIHQVYIFITTFVFQYKIFFMNILLQIGVNDFRFLENLVDLHLGQNFISNISENTFIANRKLEKLFLFFNNLEELKEKTFNGLINLSTLLINNNILTEIHYKTFTFTPNLQKL